MAESKKAESKKAESKKADPEVVKKLDIRLKPVAQKYLAQMREKASECRNIFSESTKTFVNYI